MSNESNTWVLAQNNEDVLMRFNNISEDKLLAEYPLRMGVAIPVGITTQTNAEMQKVEIFIETLLKGNGVLIAIITAKNFKEFIIYVRENLDYRKIHEDIKSAFPSFNVQMYVEKDSKWSFFKETKAGIKG